MLFAGHASGAIYFAPRANSTLPPPCRPRIAHRAKTADHAMYDLSQPNDKPGTCVKCKGTGVYGWGAMVNGKMQHSGPCFSCRGTGKQSSKQIRRNYAYNKHKVRRIIAGD